MNAYLQLQATYVRRKDLLANHTNIIRDDEDLLPASKRDELNQQALHNEMSFVLIDLHYSRFIFMSSHLKHCLPAVTTRIDVQDNWDDIYKLVHPDDRYFYCESDCKGYNCMMNVPPHLRHLFEMNYVLRLKEINGSYGAYLFRIYVWKTDEQNCPRILAGECRQLPFCKVDDFTPHLSCCILTEDKRQASVFLETTKHKKLLQSLIDTLQYHNKNSKIKETAQITHKGYQTLRNDCSHIYRWLNVLNMADACQMARLLRYI